MSKFILTLFLMLVSSITRAEVASSVSNQPLHSDFIDYKKVITEIPKTSLLGLEKSFSKESIPSWATILASTAVLYHNDEVILRDVQRSGRDLGLGNDDNTRSVLSVGDIDLLRLPTDKASALYFLGDGWTHVGIAAGFLYNGYSNNNSRAFNTGLQLAHGMVVSTIFNQFLKRSFGRESPYVRTEPFGKWSPYPSVAEYQAHTSRYDAMPSGHVMTATMVFTVINENYPEYSNYTIPIGITWVSLLSWQMVNNGVHWASDYPLGIAMGFVFGHAAAQMGKKSEESKAINEKKWMILPSSNSESPGLTFLYNY